MFRARRLYQRYLGREVFAAIFLVLAAFMALFSFFDFIDELRAVGKEGYHVGHALLAVLLGLPALVYELIPIAALIGTLYALSTLARHSEITVLRASGLATRDLLFSLFRVAAVLAVLTFVVGEGLVPLAERTAQEIKARALNKAVAQQGFRSGVWIKDGKNFINVRQVEDERTLQALRIYQFSPTNELVSVTDAQTARYTGERLWQLSGVVRTRLDGERAWVERDDAGEWRSAIDPGLLSSLALTPERMSLVGLVDYTRHLSSNHQKAERYQIALWKKLIYPLSTLVMVALALPFGYSHNRIGGVSLKIFAGVMMGILFYALNGLFSNLGAINAWPPVATAIAPSALFMLAAASMLWWVERR